MDDESMAAKAATWAIGAAPLEAAAVQIKFPCYQQVVRGADLPYDRSHEAFPGHNRLTLTAIARGVCRRWLLL